MVNQMMEPSRRVLGVIYLCMLVSDQKFSVISISRQKDVTQMCLLKNLTREFPTVLHGRMNYVTFRELWSQ